MFAASPARLARRLLPAVLVVYGCSDPSAPVSPRVEVRAPSLDVVVAKVTNTDDSGPGSLRQAVFDAATTPGTVIQFDASLAGKTIVLTSGEIDVGTRLTIEGPVPAGITLSGGLSSRLFELGADGDLTVRNVSIVNGRETFGGAASLRDGTRLMVDHVLVANNEATAVGGAFDVANGATLTIVNSRARATSRRVTVGPSLAQATSRSATAPSPSTALVIQMAVARSISGRPRS